MSWLRANNMKTKSKGLHLPAEIHRPEREVGARPQLHLGAGKSGVPGSVCIPDCTRAVPPHAGKVGSGRGRKYLHASSRKRDLCFFSDVNLGCGTGFGPIRSDLSEG